MRLEWGKPREGGGFFKSDAGAMLTAKNAHLPYHLLTLTHLDLDNSEKRLIVVSLHDVRSRYISFFTGIP